LVPCLGSGNESEDWEKGLNGLHVGVGVGVGVGEGEGELLYGAEMRVSWLLESAGGEMDELLWVLAWSTTVDVFVGR
jgi:hypothetical protein